MLHTDKIINLNCYIHIQIKFAQSTDERRLRLFLKVTDDERCIDRPDTTRCIISELYYHIVFTTHRTLWAYQNCIYEYKPCNICSLVYNIMLLIIVCIQDGGCRSHRVWSIADHRWPISDYTDFSCEIRWLSMRAWDWANIPWMEYNIIILTVLIYL